MLSWKEKPRGVFLLEPFGKLRYQLLHGRGHTHLRKMPCLPQYKNTALPHQLLQRFILRQFRAYGKKMSIRAVSAWVLPFGPQSSADIRRRMSRTVDGGQTRVTKEE